MTFIVQNRRHYHQHLHNCKLLNCCTCFFQSFYTQLFFTFSLLWGSLASFANYFFRSFFLHFFLSLLLVFSFLISYIVSSILPRLFLLFFLSFIPSHFVYFPSSSFFLRASLLFYFNSSFLLLLYFLHRPFFSSFIPISF